MIAPIEHNRLHQPSQNSSPSGLQNRGLSGSESSDENRLQAMANRSLETTRSIIADNPMAAIAVGIAIGLATGWVVKRWER